MRLPRGQCLLRAGERASAYILRRTWRGDWEPLRPAMVVGDMGVGLGGNWLMVNWRKVRRSAIGLCKHSCQEPPNVQCLSRRVQMKNVAHVNAESSSICYGTMTFYNYPAICDMMRVLDYHEFDISPIRLSVARSLADSSKFFG